jgi:pyrroloquinoline quinone (PQQ) biosynthesis protein C
MPSNLLAELARTTQELLHALDAAPAARRLLEGEVSREEYAFYLEQTYLYVRSTRPLLRRAGERMRDLGTNADLAALFLRKAEEESGHEGWALADLRALGFTVGEAFEPRPVPAIAAYLAWNTFTVEACSPIAFLGTAYVLEALSVARAERTVTNLLARSRIPDIEHAVTFLRGHAEADVDHVEQLGYVLESAATPASHHDILLSASITRAAYAGIFRRLSGWADSGQ